MGCFMYPGLFMFKTLNTYTYSIVHLRVTHTIMTRYIPVVR